ncbi:hypothetical protein QFZ49_003318 [Streptomyces turgidiscabies]|uniref:Uncharacterized protein n=1 Tax=Streptomyces turgidiscabies TaxID=85558 RepID=A0ABU0RNR5_9ACTN|nr:hypothetical protein [Streptomyces turgidiscabies]
MAPGGVRRSDFCWSATFGLTADPSCGGLCHTIRSRIAHAGGGLDQRRRRPRTSIVTVAGTDSREENSRLRAGHRCHPVLVDVSLPDQLGAVERESCAAVRAVIRKLNLSAPPEQITGQQDVAFVPVTHAQWKSVLRDADLPGLQQETDELVAEILRLRTASGRTVGKQLPELLRRLRASVVALGSVTEEVSRFGPSRTSTAEQRLATDLAQANRGQAQALFACLEQRWAESAWSAVRRYALAAQTAGRTLEAAARTDHADLPDEDVYQRTLGVSAEQLRPGSGVASRARLLAAWAEAPKTLDRRLRRSMRHLIDDSLPLTSLFRLGTTAVEAEIRKCLPDLGR